MYFSFCFATNVLVRIMALIAKKIVKFAFFTYCADKNEVSASVLLNCFSYQASLSMFTLKMKVKSNPVIKTSVYMPPHI